MREEKPCAAAVGDAGACKSKEYTFVSRRALLGYIEKHPTLVRDALLDGKGPPMADLPPAVLQVTGSAGQVAIVSGASTAAEGVFGGGSPTGGRGRRRMVCQVRHARTWLSCCGATPTGEPRMGPTVSLEVGVGARRGG